MHKLSRQVRFSINPFSPDIVEGFNSYCSKPTGEGLCLYFGLWVELEGNVDTDTGFVVNVADIDRAVREHAVAIFDRRIRWRFADAKTVPFEEIVSILSNVWDVLNDKLGRGSLNKLYLELNPFRKITIEREDREVLYFSEKFEFSAMHTLKNDNFSEEKNLEVFGKCANPAGHGHNYIIEITVKRDRESDWNMADFEHVVQSQFLTRVDHKNLNFDVPEFGGQNPTVENIASFAWSCLSGKFDGSKLSNVKVWENDRTCCSYSE
jgi:6-pyruvoyltetrahydropterin/6-carboxytetrahydropterin synthase